MDSVVPNKYIFLDIDGVLNSEPYFRDRIHIQRYDALIRKHSEEIAINVSQIDPKCVERLNRLTDITNAKIVVSSSWRLDNNLQEVFKVAKIKAPIYSRTTYSNLLRGCEIQHWLDEHFKEGDRYIILDDSEGMLRNQKPYFIKISFLYGGLSDKDVDKAISILGED